MEEASTIRQKLLRIAEFVTRMAFWIFMVSLLYGAGLFMWEYVRNPTIPLHVKLIVNSLAIFLLGLFSVFLLDEESF